MKIYQARPSGSIALREVNATSNVRRHEHCNNRGNERGWTPEFSEEEEEDELSVEDNNDGRINDLEQINALMIVNVEEVLENTFDQPDVHNRTTKMVYLISECEVLLGCGLFTGSKINSIVNLSHLFYADDAIFLGQWSELNIDSLVRVLDCFFRASGLRINMCKSKIMGVNVEDGMVKNAASKLGCLVLKTPFTYLGTKVGEICQGASWKEVVDKVTKLLGKVNKVLTSKDKWGLVVFKLFALNRGILNKDVLWSIEPVDIDSTRNNSFRRKARSGIEEMQLNSLAEISRMTTLVPCEDHYVWTLESDGVFSVASIRNEIDGNRFQDVSFAD
ncbi:hypothetical protein Tco_0311571 [Tanacetum coccineum]